MSEERCEKSDLPRSMCAHCLGHDELPEKVKAASEWFTAHFPGWCVAECGKPIEEGDDIVRAADGGYAHARCAK